MITDKDETEQITPLILCAEDEENLRVDICDELREAGYDVVEAADGDELMQQILSVTPNLILCDINMPGLNGYEVLKEVRQQRPDLNDTPFIFLSALSNPNEVITGKRLGADDYLVKPIDYDLLLATIEARLRQVRRMHDKTSLEINQLHRTMHEISSQAFVSASRALDIVALGILLLDRQGRIIHSNRAARLLAEANRHLNLGKTLTTNISHENKKLRQAISDVLKADHEQVYCLNLSRSEEERDLLVLVCALNNREHDPAAILLLSDPEKRVQVPHAVVAELFNFTPAEARIALALAEGKRTDDIATDMSISATTVAFHLRNLFQKTDTNRQADLIALILAGTLMLNLEE